MSELEAAIAGAAQLARRELRKASSSSSSSLLISSPLVRQSIALVEKAGLDTGAQARVWAWMGLCGALSEALRNAYGQSGSAVRETIFAFHVMLGYAPALEKKAAGYKGGPKVPTAEKLAVGYTKLLEVAKDDAALRGLCARLLEVLDARLTMHRYGGAAQRRQHARALLAEPLRWALGMAPVGAATGDALDLNAELLLRFWDLFRAEDAAAHGWNRIEMTQGNPLGGFFGLADESRPPTAGELRASAQQLAGELKSGASEQIVVDEQSPAAVLMQSLLLRCLELLGAYVASGQWPEDLNAARGTGRKSLWARLCKRLRDRLRF